MEMQHSLGAYIQTSNKGQEQQYITTLQQAGRPNREDRGKHQYTLANPTAQHVGTRCRAPARLCADKEHS